MKRLLTIIAFACISSVCDAAITSNYTQYEKTKWSDKKIGEKIFTVRVGITVDLDVQTKYFYFDHNPSNAEVRSAVDNYITCLGG